MRLETYSRGKQMSSSEAKARKSRCTSNKQKKWDKKYWPVHTHMDIDTRNKNVDARKTLCKRCEGTGNELFSMYCKCKDCNGTGIKRKE